MSGPEIRIPSIAQFGTPKLQGTAIGAILLIVILIWLAFTSFFTVDPEEIGVVLRFGKFVRTTEPGLHFKFPSPMEQVLKVPVQRQLKQEFGFRTDTPGVRTRYSQRDLLRESLMLTGDLNVAVVEWITQFRISDPYLFLFKVRNVDDTFRYMNEAVMREVVGDRSVNEVLTVGRQEIADEVEKRLQELCNQYETGIKVDQVVLKMINEARSEFNRIIPRARGEALQTIQQAEGYATDRVNRARGDAALFNSLLTAYQRAPGVTRRRMYLETMNEVYPKVKRKVILDAAAKNILPLLKLEEVKK
jgi:membrane protease subunit HflK